MSRVALRQRIADELVRKERELDALAAIPSWATPADRDEAWESYFESAGYEDHEAYDGISGEIDALRWVIREIDSTERSSRYRRSRG